jgi:hypothetical protein
MPGDTVEREGVATVELSPNGSSCGRRRKKGSDPADCSGKLRKVSTKEGGGAAPGGGACRGGQQQSTGQPAGKQKQKAKKEKKEKKPQAPVPPVTCTYCGVLFPSRTKMFQHLRAGDTDCTRLAVEAGMKMPDQGAATEKLVLVVSVHSGLGTEPATAAAAATAGDATTLDAGHPARGIKASGVAERLCAAVRSALSLALYPLSLSRA